MPDDRVLYVTTYLSPEIREEYDVDSYSVAAQTKMESIVRGLAAQEYSTTVISPVVPGGSRRVRVRRTEVFEVGHARVVVPPVVKLSNVPILNHLLSTLLCALTVLYVASSDDEATIFYNFRLDTTIPAVLAQLVRGVPAVVEYEDGYFAEDGGVLSRISGVLHAVFSDRLPGGVCVNAPLADALGTDNTAVVRGQPNVDPSACDPVADSDGAPAVMYGGRFDEVRGIDTFLEVVEQNADADATYWISGYGPDEMVEYVETEVDRLRTEEGVDVRFFGLLPWDEYRERLCRADVFANFQDPNHPISEYTFPSKLLDYMAVGGVIVSTDMSDLAESFEDAMVISSSAELGRVFGQVVADPAEYERLGDRASEWVETNCPDERIGESVAAVVTRC